jgi:hypothetical protein
VAFRLYFDEDSVSRALIRALVARAMEVTNAIDTGHAGSPDRVQLEHATTSGRLLFTYNVADFFALHTQFRLEGRPHAGLILDSGATLPTGGIRLFRRTRGCSGGLRAEAPAADPSSAIGRQTHYRRPLPVSGQGSARPERRERSKRLWRSHATSIRPDSGSRSSRSTGECVDYRPSPQMRPRTE